MFVFAKKRYVKKACVLLNGFYFLHHYGRPLLPQRSVAAVGTSNSLVPALMYLYYPLAPQAIVSHTSLFSSCRDHTFCFRLLLAFHAHLRASLHNTLNSPLRSYPQGCMGYIGPTGERVATFSTFPDARTYPFHGLPLTSWTRMRSIRPIFHSNNSLSYFTPVTRAEPTCGPRLLSLLPLMLPCHFSFVFTRNLISLKK